MWHCLFIITAVALVVSHLGLQTEFVIQNLTSRLRGCRSPEDMLKMWPKNELKHQSGSISRRNLTLLLYLILLWEALFIFIFMNWLCYFVTYSIPSFPPLFLLFLSPWRRNTSNVKEHLAGVCFSLQEEWCLNDWSSFLPYHTPPAPAISNLLLWVDWQVENVEKFWNILSLVEKLRRGNLCDLVIELALNWIDLEERWRHRVLSVTRQFLLISHSCGCCLNPELQTVQSVPW